MATTTIRGEQIREKTVTGFNIADDAITTVHIAAGNIVGGEQFPSTIDFDTKTVSGNLEFTGVVLAPEPTANSQVATKYYIDQAIGELVSAFNYVGTVNGGTELAPTDLALLTETDPGDYYKVASSGWFVVGAGTPFQANLNDGLVWNLVGDVDVIDNTNSTVAGTTGFIEVTGSTSNGYTVDIDEAFKASVTSTQDNLNAEITARQQADITLQANIDAEEAARIAADNTLASNLDTEITARQQADITLQANIDAEEAARIAADNTLQANLAAEITARTLADSTLQAQLPFNTYVRETPAGLKNNSNVTYTVSQTVAGSTLEVYLNGILQEPTNDYTFVQPTITMVDSPKSADTLTVTYFKVAP